MRVGGIEVSNPIFLAPLAGITNSAVRQLLIKMGVGLTHTEMVSAVGLIRDGRKTKRMLDYQPDERPLVLQLFAGDADSLVEAAEIALEICPYDGIGINMACPMPKVLKKGAGSKLLEHPDIAKEMVIRLKKLGLPVWPKIRKTIPDGVKYKLSTLEFATMLAEAGADNITIHGRTPAQRYEGKSDPQEILKSAEKLPGLISASGDIYHAEDCKYFLDNGCAAVFLARGAISDPYLPLRAGVFLGYNSQMRYENLNEQISLSRRAQDLIEFAQDLERLQGTQVAVIMTKRFVSGFFKGCQGTTEFKRNLAMLNDWNRIKEVLRRWEQYFERGF